MKYIAIAIAAIGVMFFATIANPLSHLGYGILLIGFYMISWILLYQRFKGTEPLFRVMCALGAAIFLTQSFLEGFKTQISLF